MVGRKGFAVLVVIAAVFLMGTLVSRARVTRHNQPQQGRRRDAASSSNLLVGTDSDAAGRDATNIASNLGVSETEARDAIGRQPEVGALQAALAKEDGFGGLYVTYDPYAIVVLAWLGNGTRVGNEVANLGPSDLQTYIKVVETQLTEPALLEARRDVIAADSKNVLTTSDIDLMAGTVLVTAETQSDATILQDEVKKADLPIPSSRVRVSTGVTHLQASYGGRIIVANGLVCTSGFSVTEIIGSGTGVTDAGHCDDQHAVEAGSINLNYHAEAWGGDADVQWFDTPGTADDNVVYDGAGTRNINGRTSRGSMFVNELVCKYGVASHYGCGTIHSTSYGPGIIQGHTYSATYVRMDGVSTNGGDSGCPWFSDHSAFGTHVGIAPNGDPFFMAQNFMDAINVKVKTG